MKKQNCLLIKNTKAVLADFVTPPTNILVIDGKIADISDNVTCLEYNEIDVDGAYSLPGFIDVHVHGGFDHDFMDGTIESYEEIIKGHLKRGTTLLLPTALTASHQELLRFIDTYIDFKENSDYSCLAAGLHLEGPYFSNRNNKSRGAQNEKTIREIDFNEVEMLLKKAKGNIVRWDAAPEIPNALEFARMMKANGIICAVAHTDATAEEATAGFEEGFSHVTHFYNAITAYKKRDQVVTAGVVEATYLNDDITIELICDGKHIPKDCMLLALKIKGDKVLGITDAMRLAGSEKKFGKLGSSENGTEVIVDDGVAKLPDMSSFAGSICTMDHALKVICKEYEIDIVRASKMLSAAPAKHIGVYDKYGSLEIGKEADIVIVNSDYSVKNVIKSGYLVK